MSNVIILEGPDGCGKTTLADKLIQLGYKNLVFSVPPKAARKNEKTIFDFFFEPLWQAVNTNNRTPIVCDRFHLSDAIYGHVMRDEHVMSQRVQHLIERYLEAIDATIVLCLPPYAQARFNWECRNRANGEYVKDVKKFDAVYNGYADLLLKPRWHSPLVWYDYTRCCRGSFADALANSKGFPLPHGVVGSQRPRFLFVGERPGPGHRGRNLPFLNPTGSAGWLYNALHAAGFAEEDVAFVNALKPDGSPNDLVSIIGYLSKQGLKKIITLGSIADKHLAPYLLFHAGVHKLPHPQYWKRFQSKQYQQYVQQLRKLRKELPC